MFIGHILQKEERFAKENYGTEHTVQRQDSGHNGRCYSQQVHIIPV